jgi:hypothetical protein
MSHPLVREYGLAEGMLDRLLGTEIRLPAPGAGANR